MGLPLLVGRPILGKATMEQANGRPDDPKAPETVERSVLLDRRMLILGVVALLVLGAYAGLEMTRAPKRETLSPNLGLAARQEPKAMDFDQFMGVFGLLGKDEGGVAFAKSFMKEPELAEEWKAFQKDRDVPAFVENLKEAPAFKKVVRENAAKNPGFKPLVERTLKLLPGLSQLLQSGSGGGSLGLVVGGLPRPERYASAGPAASLSGTGSTGGSKVGRYGAVSSRGPARIPTFDEARQSAFGRALGGGAGGAPGGGAAAPAFAGIGDARNSGAVVAAVDGRAGTPLSADRPEGGSRNAPDANSTLPLPQVQGVQSEAMQRLLQRYPWLANLSEQERQALVSSNLIEQHGLWGACFALGIYQSCRNACAASGGQCVPVDGWHACLDFKNNDFAACYALCPRQPGCTPPRPPPGRGGNNSTTGACAQCTGWVDTDCGPGDTRCGSGPSAGFRSTRRCPPNSGCNESQAHQPTDPLSCSDGTRRAPGGCPNGESNIFGGPGTLR